MKAPRLIRALLPPELSLAEAEEATRQADEALRQATAEVEALGGHRRYIASIPPQRPGMTEGHGPEGRDYLIQREAWEEAIRAEGAARTRADAARALSDRLRRAVEHVPERKVLADAIADAVPLRTAADAARAKAEAARGALALAADAVPVAERAAEEAKAYLIENPHAPRADLRAKRQSATDAADDLAIAREVSAKADAAEVEAADAVRRAENGIAEAADAVVVSNFAAALEAAERAGREFARLAFVAEAIASSAPMDGGQYRNLSHSVATLNAHVVFRGDGRAAAVVQAEAAAPWKAARAALLIDASAALPEVG